MGRLQRGKTGWLGRLGWHQPDQLRAPLLASRDLPSPPVDSETRLPLPRSPEPLPDEALRFMRHAAARAADPAPDEGQTILTTGAELRALLEQVEEKISLRTAIEQAKEAQRRLNERLWPSAQESAGQGHADFGSTGQARAAKPVLQLVPEMEMARRAASARDLQAALSEALETLRRLSAH